MTVEAADEQTGVASSAGHGTGELDRWTSRYAGRL